VKRERPMIKCGQRDATAVQTETSPLIKAARPPSGNDVGKSLRNEANPRVGNACDDQNEVVRAGSDMLQMDMGFGKWTGLRAWGDSAAPSATAREASLLRLTSRVQRLEERHQSCCFRGLRSFHRRHVPSTLDHLSNKLGLR